MYQPKDLFEAASKGDQNAVKDFVETKGAQVDGRNVLGETALLKAVQGGHLPVIKYLIDKGADPNAKDNKWGYNPLLWAIEKDVTLEVIQFLVQKGAAVMARDNDKSFTPLHWAAFTGRLDVVKYLIEMKAEVGARSTDGDTPLHIAAVQDHKDVVHYLIEENKIEYHGNIFLASREGQIGIVRYFIENKGMPADSRNEYGMTPLHIAAEYGQLAVVRYLLSVNNELINSLDLRNDTPLHRACKNDGNLAIIRYLVDRKADIYATNKQEVTPILVAVENGQINYIKYFVSIGINLNSIYWNNDQPLFNFAVKGGHLNMVKYLVEEAKIDLTLRSASLYNSIQIALDKRHKEIFRYLLEKNIITKDEELLILHFTIRLGDLSAFQYLLGMTKIDLSERTPNGFTLLHTAILYNQFLLVKYLVEQRGLAVTAKTNKGQNALHIAAGKRADGNENLNVISYLVETRRMNVNEKDNDGNTPLNVAASAGHLSIVSYLVGKNESNIYERNIAGYAPIHNAAIKGKLNVVKYFIEDKKVPINIRAPDGVGLLHMAAVGLNLDLVKYLVEDQKMNIQMQNNYARTPLHEASFQNNLNMTEYLVSRGANVNSKDRRFGANSLLFSASTQMARLDVVQYLVEQGADIFVRNTTNGYSACLYSAEFGKLDILKYLTEKGCNVNDKYKSGGTLLHHAAIEGRENVVGFLIDEKGVKFEGNLLDAARKGYIGLVLYLLFQKKQQLTPDLLSVAIQNGQLGVIKALVPYARNFILKGSSGSRGLSLAMLAAKEGQVEILKYFTEELGVEPSLTVLDAAAEGGSLSAMKYLLDDRKVDTSTKYPLLLRAAQSGNVELVKYLMNNKNMNVQIVDSFGNNILHIAASFGHLLLVKYLIEEKILDIRNVNAKTELGWQQTALHYAAQMGHLPILKYLIEKGADLNTRDINGQSVLHTAVEYDHLDVVKYLLDEQKMDVEIKNFLNNTPIVRAAARGFYNLVRFLGDEKQANVTVKSNNGRNIVHMAVYGKNLEVIKYLIDTRNMTDAVDAVDEFNETPSLIAASLGLIDILRYFIDEKHADTTITDKNDFNLLHSAALNGQTDMVRWLVEVKGMDPLMSNNAGETPLSLAESLNHPAVVKYLETAEPQIRIRRSLNNYDDEEDVPLNVITSEESSSPWMGIPDSSGTIFKKSFIDFSVDNNLILADTLLRYLKNRPNVRGVPIHQSLWSPRDLLDSRIDDVAVDAVNSFDYE